MKGQHFYGHSSSTRSSKKGVRPAERHGIPQTGRIAKLLVGQGQGFIRLENYREAFFHRSDVENGMSINDFAVGDAVAFELMDDDVSGARAVHVRRAGVLGIVR